MSAELITPAQAEERYGIAASTIRTWAQRGHLPSVAPGLYRDSDVIACARARMPASLRNRLYRSWANLQREVDHCSTVPRA